MTAWGAGCDWVLASVPELLGAADDLTGFAPRHERVEAAWHRHPHWRQGRTGLVVWADGSDPERMHNLCASGHS